MWNGIKAWSLMMIVILLLILVVSYISDVIIDSKIEDYKCRCPSDEMNDA